MDTLITASVWQIVRTTRRYISWYCVHIPVRVTSSTCCPGLSLGADLADAAQEEGDGTVESVPASAVKKECEAVSCELGNRYPALQSTYVGKLDK